VLLLPALDVPAWRQSGDDKKAEIDAVTNSFWGCNGSWVVSTGHPARAQKLNKLTMMNEIHCWHWKKGKGAVDQRVRRDGDAVARKIVAAGEVLASIKSRGWYLRRCSRTGGVV